jgi:short-chain fatty acids transporter
METPTAVRQPHLTPIQRIGEAIADRVERWMPSPFLFAIILTYVAGLVAFAVEGAGLPEITTSWYEGFWSLVQFSMQMVIILVTATVVAYHPRVRGLILRLVRLPRNGKQAVVLVALGSMLSAWVSWGLGLIFGAILAHEMGREAARRDMPVHYPLLAVSGYIGIGLNWGWGLSSSPGLLQATEGNVLMQMGFVDRVIPATEWVFHPYPLTLTALAIVYGCVTFWLLCPPDEHCRGVEAFGVRSESSDEGVSAPVTTGPVSLADRIDNSKLLGGLLALTGVVLSVNAFLTKGFGALDLNVLNFAFLMAGLLLYLSPTRYQKDFYRAVQGSAGIILLYPFYAGIIGIMTGTGLVDTVTSTLLSVATTKTFPVIAWITAAVLNVFVPSAGGEWAMVGGPMMVAGAQLGIPHGQTIAAYVAGDSHTNLFNPFWALPLLAITGLRARDVFGYAIAMMLLLIPFFALALYFLPY